MGPLIPLQAGISGDKNRDLLYAAESRDYYRSDTVNSNMANMIKVRHG